MLEWNVYTHNINRGTIERHNVFDHAGLMEDLSRFLKKHPDADKESFVRKLKSNLMYYYWSKAEWEVLVKPLFWSSSSISLKIDAFDQVALNFDIFADYCWNHKNEIENWKEGI